MKNAVVKKPPQSYFPVVVDMALSIASDDRADAPKTFRGQPNRLGLDSREFLRKPSGGDYQHTDPG